MMNSELTKKR